MRLLLLALLVVLALLLGIQLLKDDGMVAPDDIEFLPQTNLNPLEPAEYQTLLEISEPDYANVVAAGAERLVLEEEALEYIVELQEESLTGGTADINSNGITSGFVAANQPIRLGNKLTTVSKIIQDQMLELNLSNDDFIALADKNDQSDIIYYMHRITKQDQQGLWGIIQYGIKEKFTSGIAVGRGENVQVLTLDIPGAADEIFQNGYSSFLGKVIYFKSLYTWIYNFQEGRVSDRPDVLQADVEVALVPFKVQELIGVYQYFVKNGLIDKPVNIEPENEPAAVPTSGAATE